MIIEDERDFTLPFEFDNVSARVKPQRNPDMIQAYLETYRQTGDNITHTQCHDDLIDPQMGDSFPIYSFDCIFIHV
jgi:hypothetical protein